MLLQEAYSQLQVRCGLSSSTADKARIVAALKESLKEICRRNKFVALRDTASLTTTSATSIYYLDSRVMFVQETLGLGLTAADDDGSLIEIWSQTRFNKTYPDPKITADAEPTIMVPIKQVWVTTQPTAASTIAIASSSAGDVTSYYAVVRGIASGSGSEVRERVTLTGSAAASTSNTYSSLISITKDATVGTITATSNSGGTTNITLLPEDTEKSHWQVKLHPVPNSAYTISYPFYIKPWNFSYDEDLIPIEQKFEDLLLDWASANLLAKQGDQKAVAIKQMAELKLDEVLKDDYFSEDEDKRMSLIEIDEQGESW